MRASLRPTLWFLALGFLLLAAGSAWNLRSFNREALVQQRYQPIFVVLPRVEVVKTLALGFNAMAADWYWIKGVNYFGDQRNVAVAYGEFYNYLKLVTALDPKYFPAYLFGGYALPWNRGDKWVNTEETAELLESGVKEFPNDWRLRFQLAFVYSSYLHRYKDAGNQLAAAANMRGAPPYLASLATRMYAATGDYAGSELLADQLIEQTNDPSQREILERRILELRASSEGDRLTKAVENFRKRTGHNPASLEELASAGVKIGPDPLGGTWKYDPAKGTVISSQLRERLDLFVKNQEQQKEQKAQEDAAHAK